jgi:hypothetical protein
MLKFGTFGTTCQILVLLTAAPVVLHAQSVPPMISFQGVLTDPGGSGITDLLDVMFSIYDVPESGTAKWSEAQGVDVIDGLFNVFLGAVNPLPDSIFTGEVLWLGVTVQPDEEMTPRQMLVSTPYSFTSGRPLCLPAGFEVCDGIDNDCNGKVDDGVSSIWYGDSDEDGFGDPSVSIGACSQPTGHVDNDQDCDDTQFEINPSAEEICDEVDNNCDGQVDEVC